MAPSRRGILACFVCTYCRYEVLYSLPTRRVLRNINRNRNHFTGASLPFSSPPPSSHVAGGIYCTYPSRRMALLRLIDTRLSLGFRTLVQDSLSTVLLPLLLFDHARCDAVLSPADPYPACITWRLENQIPVDHMFVGWLRFKEPGPLMRSRRLQYLSEIVSIAHFATAMPCIFG